MSDDEPKNVIDDDGHDALGEVDADGKPLGGTRDTPGGPYFGRLLVVLFAAVVFCGFMTWLLSTLMMN